MKSCKNCPAYAKCTVTYRGSACDALRGTYGVDSDPEIKTNADRIRTMSDEKLAEYIFDLGNGSEYCYGHCAYQDSDNCPNDEAVGCLSGVLKWLRQPAEEER